MNMIIKRNELSPLQMQLLNMFKWFHSFCQSNSIRYYSLGGTMLGAVRHEGFIPWDDDIDVGIPRKDYERLRFLSSTIKKETHYCFEFPDTHFKNFATPYAKLYDTSTTLIENYRHPYERGVFIDVFPLDGTGNSKKESDNNYKSIRKLYNFFMTRVAVLSEKRSMLKNAAILSSRLIPNMVIPTRTLRIMLDKRASSLDFDDCMMGGNIFGNWGNKEIMNTSIMGQPKEYLFNGILINGVEKYDEYLTNLYGKWKILPPAEKRISHHDFLKLDLKNSYLQK